MEAVRAAELAKKAQLDLGDWVEITGVNTYRLGLYSIGSDGVRFHPNKESDEPGWSEEQNKEAELLALEGTWYETKRHAEEANASQLAFPCTPKELVEFVLIRDASGDLYGLLPGLFIVAVYEADTQQRQRAITTEQAEAKDAEPSPKGRNSYLRTIAALADALIDGRTGKQNTDANAILSALAKKNVEAPITSGVLAGYLKQASEI